MSLSIVHASDWFEAPAGHAAQAVVQDPLFEGFEGEPVHGVRGKLIGATNLELDTTHRIDDIVTVTVTARVVRVDHIVEERSGHLIRSETFRITDVQESGSRG